MGLQLISDVQACIIIRSCAKVTTLTVIIIVIKYILSVSLKYIPELGALYRKPVKKKKKLG